MSDLQSLLSMGFPKRRAEEALRETDSAGLEVALEWLLVTDGIETVQSDKEERGEEKDCKQKSKGISEEKSLASSSKPIVNAIVRETQALTISDSKTVSQNSYIETRILVRLLNGQTLTKTFNANAKLNDIFVWIKSHVPIDEFALMTSFPRKIFTHEDYGQSLNALNLVPSAALIVTQPDKWNELKEYRGAKAEEDESRKIEEKRRNEEIEKRTKEIEEERLALERVRTQIKDDKAARRQRWPSLYTDQSLGGGNNQLMQNQSNPLMNRNDSNRKKKFE